MGEDERPAWQRFRIDAAREQLEKTLPLVAVIVQGSTEYVDFIFSWPKIPAAAGGVKNVEAMLRVAIEDFLFAVDPIAYVDHHAAMILENAREEIHSIVTGTERPE